MSEAPDLLFAYGTLMRGLPLHHLIERRAEFLGGGSMNGRLVDLGGYPGALPDRVATVRGEVYRLLCAELLAALDAAEGPEFFRRLTPVSLDDGREMQAWVYWFTRRASRAVPIPDGDYRRHVTAHSWSRERPAPLSREGIRWPRRVLPI
ncbi:MAG: gamma-glutamylcyclotransferase [Candidatus Rokubacteria bacterium]|nr:gamma-glutamylcyclotransferase [Candidatus Rokubacteria bacterium]